ncbi:hypothetical protein [Rhizobium sp. MHM7A]|uniref:hypothetical protein n=1 Tax=Rhizobium sp. MHM7A TaxID=2583233 RepID=UPI001107057B|nr:hypothetical protein [Rhizobium sp. MHM7A]TLX16477.1 hypothetical protein FFR93_03835 [Rhizobium sp. MHM7A]
MQTSTTGNERFYLEVVKAETAAQEAHSALFSTHADAYNRYFDLASDFGEPYVRENFPDITNSVELINASSAQLQELRSNSPARRNALIESLVAEMREIGAKGGVTDDPVVRLRSDLMELSSFRSERLDGVKIDFWLVNAKRQVSHLDKNGLSGPAITAWCKARGIKPKTLDEALWTIAPLWDQYPHQPIQIISTVSAALDNYPFDADNLLESARSWPEANPELVEGVITARNLTSSMSPGR